MLTKIASQCSKKDIKTVKEAMELAKKEHRQYTEWAKEKKTAQLNQAIIQKNQFEQKYYLIGLTMDEKEEERKEYICQKRR